MAFAFVMGPGTIRCLAHSAWPMLWVRQCALSPYPLLDCQLIAFLRIALAAVAETAGITTLRPDFQHGRDECASERLQVARAHRGGRSERAALRRTRKELCCFQRRARRERSSTPLRSGVARSSSKVMHAFGL